MNELITIEQEYGLKNTEKGIVTNSRLIADKFNKEHKNEIGRAHV
jgi:phage regulator Rha-like protein